MSQTAKYDIFLKHFTGSFILTDNSYIPFKFHVHDVAFKT